MIGIDDLPPFRTAPEDPTSVRNLAGQGLRYTRVETGDAAEFGDWLHADDRGFLQANRTFEQLKPSITGIGDRRTIGVYDDKNPSDDGWPIATVNSWPAALTLPGSTAMHPRTMSSWAISSVTVASTHRRRGIARNLLEGELRTAAALGMPMAMLTVSESTIYGRFGFAPAALAANWTIDTRRVRWSGAAAPGRVEYVTIERYRTELPPLHDRLRLSNPGDIEAWPLRWDQLVGAAEPDASRTKELRAVRYVDEAGATQGLALFRLSGGEEDFVEHSLTVERLDAETGEADLALWRFLLAYDLTIEVKARLRRVEEPMRWAIGDFRAARVNVWEHQYLRVLDVAASFEARGYLGSGSVVFDVTDQLGFAEGRWRLTAESGVGHVEKLSADEHTGPELKLTANELAAIYLGGVSVNTLVGAGRITELRPGSAEAADALLRVERAPWLSVWY